MTEYQYLDGFQAPVKFGTGSGPKEDETEGRPSMGDDFVYEHPVWRTGYILFGFSSQFGICWRNKIIHKIFYLKIPINWRLFKKSSKRSYFSNLKLNESDTNWKIAEKLVGYKISCLSNMLPIFQFHHIRMKFNNFIGSERKRGCLNMDFTARTPTPPQKLLWLGGFLFPLLKFHRLMSMNE